MKTIAVLALLLAACKPQPVHYGGNNGPKHGTVIDEMIKGLRTYELGYKPPDYVKPDTAGAQDFLKLFFDRAYDGVLADAVYFADVKDWDKGPAIYSQLTRGTERPTILVEDQNIWALVMVAAPKGDCFSAEVNFETIVPPASPTESGILAAILLLTKLGSPSDHPKPQSKHVDLYVPSVGCEKLAHAAAGDEGKGPPTGASAFRYVGDTTLEGQPRSLYAGLVKLDLVAGTTNRIVVSVQRTVDVAVDDKGVEPKTSAVTTFRNASRPYFAASAALGARFEWQGIRTTNGTTEQYHPYDPDLYVLVHGLLLVPACLSQGIHDRQLTHEYYPSLFAGTSLVVQGPLNDLIAGIRIPLGIRKFGMAAGVDWSKYSFNLVPGCTSMCAVRTDRHFAYFLGFDYEL